ncbi:mitochondrial ribosomal death-associated protein 3-domain-containing protein [Flammula alnicola]|nr:mitochondrial ribosomal death-associated protein 3-domain-containing protein [Flammula alnicola]
MSALAAVARPGPSTVLSRVLAPQTSRETRRYKSVKTNVGQVASSQAGYLLKRKADQEKKSKNRKKLPMFKSLPPAQLDHPLFKAKAAFEVQPFQPKTIQDPTTIGQPFVINPPENDPMRIFGLPRKLWLEFKLLSKPYTVVRQVTKDALDLLAIAKNQPSSETRVVFTGRPGCGKSFLLLQAVENCVQQNWVVLYFPRGIDLINSTTTIPTTSARRPTSSPVNKKAFKKITLPVDLVLEKQAPVYLEAVMKALEAQKDYPVLLAVDEFQTLYGKTEYRDPHFVPIHSYHLSLPRMIMEYASGKRSFQKGAILGSISASRTTHPLPLELRDALALNSPDLRPVSPYEKRNKTMLEYAEGLRSLEVPEKLTLAEAVGVFEVWKQQQVFGNEKFFYDEAFLGKYTESGGNARDFVWKGLLASLDA